MVNIALGWMIGTGICLLILPGVSPLTGIMLILFGVLGFVELLTRGRG